MPSKFNLLVSLLLILLSSGVSFGETNYELSKSASTEIIQDNDQPVLEVYNSSADDLTQKESIYLRIIDSKSILTPSEPIVIHHYHSFYPLIPSAYASLNQGGQYLPSYSIRDPCENNSNMVGTIIVTAILSIIISTVGVLTVGLWLRKRKSSQKVNN